MTENLQVGVVGLPGGWSSERLADALHQLTGFRRLIDLARVVTDLGSGQAWDGQVELTSLDGLVIKKVGPAYSPDLLDRLELIRFLAARGVRVFSPPDNIIRVLNRLSCTVSLARAGVPLPPTVITESPAEAVRAVERFGPSVLKPLYTSKARGMVLVVPGDSLQEEIENFHAAGNKMIYVQQVVDLPGRDLGLVFLGGNYLATYARVNQGNSWNTTTHSGGKYQCHTPGDEVRQVADKAQAVFGLDFTCVDVAETENGPVVFEVSAFGGFRGLSEGCSIDAAAVYAEYVIKELGK
jgi:ribosomal protein S6--L-glutamate ligase